MKSKVFVLAVSLVVYCSCAPGTKKEVQQIQPETYTSVLKKGNAIATQAQGVLLANVGKAIQQGGTEYAVEFCNLQASGITDSLNRVNDVVISRVSGKNRNPQNNLKDEEEKGLWQFYVQHPATGDTLVLQNDKIIYYKPIRTAMPACLKCHGNPDSDIEPATLQKIRTLYPDDLATGYKLNDFRGLWKVEFN